ncbi:MAG TPA: hypothetical protein VGS18_04725, partial [Thermoplasmata archaeon]|nr:hypothetical protein [Thermoplasmata archaeon]
SGVAALIPDGSPHATAGSSGVVFLDAGFEGPARLDETLRYGRSLLDLDELARRWRSAYASPDWPEFGAPEAFLTGRATVTRFDVSAAHATEGAVTLVAAHAENDAPNQIAEAVTLVFEGPSDRLERLADAIPSYVIPPFHSIRPARATALPVPPGALSVQIVGQSAHGGYPHRGHNPVPIALGVLERAVSDGLLNVGGGGASTFSVDLRLIPEMRLEQGRGEALRRVESFLRRELPRGRIDAPLARARGGYSLPTDHPAVGKLERLVRSEFGVGGIFGEYGGTDASSLVGVSTPAGEPIPALVFGSIDRSARIHEAEESVDPISIGRVSRIIERFVREP